MKPSLTTLAVSALMLFAAGPTWAQSSPTVMAPGYCNRSTGDIADCLNRAIADRNDAATAAAYGSSGVTRYDTPPAVPTTTTTITTTTRTIAAPPYPGGDR